MKRTATCPASAALLLLLLWSPACGAASAVQGLGGSAPPAAAGGGPADARLPEVGDEDTLLLETATNSEFAPGEAAATSVGPVAGLPEAGAEPELMALEEEGPPPPMWASQVSVPPTPPELQVGAEDVVNAVALPHNLSGPSSNWTEIVAQMEDVVSDSEVAEDAEGERLEEQAFLAIRGRLTKNRRDSSSLKKRLTEALRWGRELQHQLEDARHLEKQALQQALEKENRKAEAVINAERRRERALEHRIGNLSNAVRIQTVAMASLRREEDDEKRAYDAAQQAWRARETKLEFEDETATQAVAARDATIQWMQAAKQSEDAELNASKLERARVAAQARTELLEARSREQQLLEKLDEDRREEAVRNRLLHNQLALKTQQGEEEQARAERLQRALYELQGAARAEVSNLTMRLKDAVGRQEGANRMRDALTQALTRNATEAARLADEVNRLQEEVADLGKQRDQALAAERKAEHLAAQAEATAEQMAGAVPPVLRQDYAADDLAGGASPLSAAASPAARRDDGGAAASSGPGAVPEDPEELAGAYAEPLSDPLI